MAWTHRQEVLDSCVRHEEAAGSADDTVLANNTTLAYTDALATGMAEQ